tara:strand:+ start:7151 stop:7996 length:846 start_codon:yes stop_codon:yes gene_type:complete
MTASFDTLEDDLKSLWDKGIEPSEKDLEEFAENIKEAVVASLTRSKTEVDGKREVLRMSSIGKPMRQLWYAAREDAKAENFSYSTLLKFLYGSIIEELLVLLVKTAGHSVTGQQEEHDIEGVKGHSDGRIDGVLVDFKSASGRSLLKFKNKNIFFDDPFGYIAQISAYAEKKKDDRAAFVVMDKQAGELVTMELSRSEMIDPMKRIADLKEALSKDTPPDLCYWDEEDGKSGNRKLAVGCSYCQFKSKCWPNLRAFKYSNGTRFLTVVEREPNVEEVFVEQ